LNTMFMNNTYLMTAPRNRVGITRIWKTLEGKNVKTNDGKDLGEIKKISEDFPLSWRIDGATYSNSLT
ncbi:MAG: hypothetical protein WA364_22865, partial [Candidatus Nitrosopolaris sp.]